MLAVIKNDATYRKHLISLVENEQLHAVGLEDTTLDHILDTAGSTDNDMGTLLESLHILADVGTTDTSVALDAHEVTNGDHDLLDLLGQLTSGSEDQRLAGLQVGVDLLQSGDGEGSSLAGTRLGLSDDIVACFLVLPDTLVNGRTLDDGHDGPLLNSRGTLETVGIDTWIVRRVRGEYTENNIPRSSSDFRSMESNESVISS